MQRLKKFSILLLSFLPITYVYGYDYIEIKTITFQNYTGSILQLKKGLKFDDGNSDNNQAIISEIMKSLQSEDQKIDVINLFNKKVGKEVLNLFIQGLKNIPEKNYRDEISIEMNLSTNNIDYDTLKFFFNALSTKEVYMKFKLEALNLSSNRIRGFLDTPGSCEMIHNLLICHPCLKYLNLKGNFNFVTATGLSKLYKELKSVIASAQMKNFDFIIDLTDSSQKAKEKDIIQSILNEFLSIQEEKVSKDAREDAEEFFKKVRF